MKSATLLGFALFVAIIAAIPPRVAIADFLDQQITVAKPDPLRGPDGKPQKLDFDFSNLKGWLRDNGAYQIEGFVAHDGFLCGTYEVGLRFGSGDRGCTRVQWLTEVAYLTRKRQCNNATVGHAANEYDPALARLFAKISCVERTIRCSGVCTAYTAPPTRRGTDLPQPPLFEQ